MKTLNSLVALLTILTIVTIVSNGLTSGLLFFGTGAIIVLIGSYANSLLTSKQ